MFLYSVFVLKFSLVVSCECSIMSVASGGFAPRPPPGLCPGTQLGDFCPPDPLFRIPFWEFLDPPLGEGGRIAYWLEECELQNRTCGLFSSNQDVLTPLLIFNSKVISFTHLFLDYIAILNLCRLFSHIGYAACHFKETHLTTLS